LIRFDDLYSDPAVRRIARRKAAALSRSCGFTWSDRDDFEQEFWISLWRAMHRFDPARGSRAAWASAILERAAAKLLRRRKSRKRGGAAGPFTAQDERNAALAALDKSFRDVDRRRDLETLLATMPDEQQNLATQLRGASLTEAARAAGKPRIRFRRLAERIRAAFIEAGFQEYL
jgi:RNA polymerase sigma factor (sigma-70 family)